LTEEVPVVKQVLPFVLLVLGPLTVIGRASGSDQVPVPIAERARGAERVVAGRVTSVTPVWQTNDHGDRLIVSVVRVSVTEIMKGESSPTVDVEVEGGTIGTLTLRVSDQLTFTPGERAIFFVRRDRRGRFVPHLRGQGTIKLDAAGRVPGTSLTLGEIRREVTGRAR
jgi:molybdopterin-binding protein